MMDTGTTKDKLFWLVSLFLPLAFVALKLPLYSSIFEPKIGTSGIEVVEKMGEPSRTFTTASKLTLPPHPWIEPGGSRVLSSSELPVIKDTAWLYNRGLLGTFFILIYLEDKNVVRVFTHRT
jgi:hypothetical protein